MKDRPIGVFDSGVGGLTVVRELLALLPEERVIYFADNAYVPYGSRPLEQVAEFAQAIVRFLEEQGVKMVVTGCNMSSAALMDGLVKPGRIPLVGLVEPACRAVALRGCKRVGVLATPGTVKSGIYSRAIVGMNPGCEVLEEACSELVPLVEAGEFGSEQSRSVVKAHLSPLLNWGMDTVLLGCTHYPFLLPAIEQVIGSGISVIDPAREVAVVVRKALAGGDSLSPSSNGLPHRFFASGDPVQLGSFAEELFGLQVGAVEKRDVHPS